MSRFSPVPAPGSLRFRLHAVLLILSIAFLLFKLLDPRPVESVRPPDWLMYYIAKTFHIGAFVWCTLLGLTLHRSLTWRIAFAGFMVWLGIGTEIAQTYIPNRSGQAKDVGFDTAGITIAAIMVWLWERRRPLN